MRISSILIPMAALIIGACGSKTESEMKPVPTSQKIADGVLTPWQAADHPALVEKIGRPAFDRAAGLFDEAGRKAADNPACNRLASVGIDDKSARDIVILSTTCSNGLKQNFLETMLRPVRQSS